jgi:dTDP-4-dehydrorhamnose 3,5-epimerase
MIEGVIIKELVTHTDDRGFFREVFRFSEEFKNLSIGQLSHSLVKEGVIKAWHGHVYQSQWNYVITGIIKVVLYDNRSNSSTLGEIIELMVGNGEDSKAYYFPLGILHGYKCIKGPLHIIYVTSGVYDLDDEIRIPIDYLEKEYRW